MLHTKLAKTIYLAAGICFLQFQTAQAQSISTDTIRINIKDAEKMFLEKNLSLLAQHYEIESSKALIQQAKLWDNPVLNTDQNAYAHGRFFPPVTDSTGQIYVQVQQLIKTAGKRGKQIKMAKTNAEISEWQFKDVMRKLRAQLHTDYYTVIQLLGNKRLYDLEKEQLDRLLTGMNAEFKSGNIAKKDLLRIQALQIDLQQDATENDKKLDDTQAELRTMLQIDNNAFLKPADADIPLPNVPEMSVSQLIELARQNNSTYQLQQMQYLYQQQNLKYQKALAIPDVTLGPNFDRLSNYTPNYIGLGISLQLPIFDRNQGNIKSARWQVKEKEANVKEAELDLQNSLQSAYNKLRYTLQLSSATQQSFYKDYGQLYNNVVESFKQRQIGMVEFIDYFDAYKDAMQKQLQQELNVQLAKDELNMQVGVDVVQ